VTASSIEISSDLFIVSLLHLY